MLKNVPHDTNKSVDGTQLQRYHMVAMEEKKTQSLRFRLTPTMKRNWKALCKKKRIKQQEAIEGFIVGLLALDDQGQSVTLGQIETSPKEPSEPPKSAGGKGSGKFGIPKSSRLPPPKENSRGKE